MSCATWPLGTARPRMGGTCCSSSSMSRIPAKRRSRTRALATSAWNREPRRSKVHRAMEWPEPYVRTIKRDYVRVSLNCRPVVDVDAVADQCPCAVGKVEVDVVHRARFRVVEILDGDLGHPCLASFNHNPLLVSS